MVDIALNNFLNIYAGLDLEGRIKTIHVFPEFNDRRAVLVNNKEERTGAPLSDEEKTLVGIMATSTGEGVIYIGWRKFTKMKGCCISYDPVKREMRRHLKYQEQFEDEEI